MADHRRARADARDVAADARDAVADLRDTASIEVGENQELTLRRLDRTRAKEDRDAGTSEGF